MLEKMHEFFLLVTQQEKLVDSFGMELKFAASIMTFFLLWTLSLLLPICLGEEFQDVQVKITKESKECKMKAEFGDYLSVHYTGRLTDENGDIFDTSHKRGQLFKFQLGAGQVHYLAQNSVKMQSKLSQNAFKMHSKCIQNEVKMQPKISQNSVIFYRLKF